jgi:hypothetical protein
LQQLSQPLGCTSEVSSRSIWWWLSQSWGPCGMRTDWLIMIDCDLLVHLL